MGFRHLDMILYAVSGLKLDGSRRRERHGLRRPVLAKFDPVGAYSRAWGTDSFAHFPTMDGYICIDLEAQPYLAAIDFQHRDFEHALEAGGASDDHGFLTFPR
jgi:hypothetical protein